MTRNNPKILSIDNFQKFPLIFYAGLRIITIATQTQEKLENYLTEF